VVQEVLAQHIAVIQAHTFALIPPSAQLFSAKVIIVFLAICILIFLMGI